MAKAPNLAGGLKAWIMNVEVDEGATWFLFSLVYALGLSSDELGLKFSGIIPQFSAPLVSLAMVFLCLVVSSIILIAPLLPSKMRTWTENSRSSGWYQILRQFSMLFAFILGWFAGLNLLNDKLSEFSWLTTLIAYMGFGIFLMLGVRIALARGLDPKPYQKKQS